MTSPFQSLSLTPEFVYAGAVVKIRNVDGYFYVTKVTSSKTKPVHLEGEDGQLYSASFGACLETTHDESEALHDRRDARRVAVFNELGVGVCVKVDGKDGIWVVTAPINASGLIKASPLGGAGNTYLRCSANTLTAISMDEVKAILNGKGK